MYFMCHNNNNLRLISISFRISYFIFEVTMIIWLLGTLFLYEQYFQVYIFVARFTFVL